jgi:hypothetical protein
MPAEEGRVLGQRGIRSTGELFRMLARSLALARLVTRSGRRRHVRCGGMGVVADERPRAFGIRRGEERAKLAAMDGAKQCRAFRNRPLRVYRTSVFEPVGRVVDHLLDLRNLLRLLLAQREPEVEGEVAVVRGQFRLSLALCAPGELVEGSVIGALPDCGAQAASRDPEPHVNQLLIARRHRPAKPDANKAHD